MKHMVEQECADYLPSRRRRRDRRKFPDGSLTACPKCGTIFRAISRIGGGFEHSFTYYTWQEAVPSE